MRSSTRGIKTIRDPLLIQIKKKKKIELGTLCMSIQIK